ncbi:MAG: hypothetical protein H6922_06365 [Pseudomonadaceae bacterium]|nr:hypothetical protein [Pseudomonadaceae bacterium]
MTVSPTPVKLDLMKNAAELAALEAQLSALSPRAEPPFRKVRRFRNLKKNLERHGHQVE